MLVICFLISVGHRLKKAHVEYLFQCFVNFCHALRNFYREISPGSRDKPLERFWGGDEYFRVRENLMKKIHARRVALKILPHWPKGKC